MPTRLPSSNHANLSAGAVIFSRLIHLSPIQPSIFVSPPFAPLSAAEIQRTLLHLQR